MSRIGKKPVPLPKGAEAKVDGNTVTVKGPKGSRSFTFTEAVSVAVDGGQITVTPVDLTKASRQQWGLTRSMVENLVTGEGSDEQLPHHAVCVELLAEAHDAPVTLL